MERQTSVRLVMTVLTFVAVAFFSAQSVQAEEKTAPAAPSLYDRLGGVYSIATVVDDFIERLLVNDILNANPKIKEARDRVPKAGLKFHVTALICQLSGGTQTYTGRNMKDTHANLNINEKEWDAMVADFVACLNHFKVPEKEQGELLALVGPTKTDIVTAK
ncbi:MAG: group 1 truncated hemoglobin [Candidatus Zixiibacteriota bacterium]